MENMMADIAYTAPGASFKNAFAVTENDAKIYAPKLQALYVGTQGTVVIDPGDGTKVPYVAMIGWMYVEIARIWETSTAADIVGHR